MIRKLTERIFEELVQRISGQLTSDTLIDYDNGYISVAHIDGVIKYFDLVPGKPLLQISRKQAVSLCDNQWFLDHYEEVLDILTGGK